MRHNNGSITQPRQIDCSLFFCCTYQAAQERVPNRYIFSCSYFQSQDYIGRKDTRSTQRDLHAAWTTVDSEQDLAEAGTNLNEHLDGSTSSIRHAGITPRHITNVHGAFECALRHGGQNTPAGLNRGLGSCRHATVSTGGNKPSSTQVKKHAA